jgi:cysteine desulfurase/selenocysteine lyase
MSALDVARIQADFPILKRQVNGKRLVYLDSASSAQKPQSVLDAMDRVYRESYANVHRGVYTIAEEATAAFEAGRAKVARFVGARETREIVFTRNATESINLVAYTWARANMKAGDVIVLSHLEHHANVVPWHMLAAERGVELRWIPLTADQRLDLTDLDRLLDGAALLAITAMSNVVGTIVDIGFLVAAARAAGAHVLVDACQAVPQMPVDVSAWDADFVAFSSHKMLGPSGLGALWARAELLEAMPPFLGGGEMIRDVTTEGFSTNDIPWKFEAGTPAIAEALGLGAAVDYLTEVGLEAIGAHEHELLAYALDKLGEIEGVTCYGPPPERRAGIVSFNVDGIHPHDVAQVLDWEGIAIRAGHHCTQPLHERLGEAATARASFNVYSDRDDIDRLAVGLQHVMAVFGRDGRDGRDPSPAV